MAKLYESLKNILKTDPLNNKQAKLLELLNKKLDKILKKPNSNDPFTLVGLKIDQNLRKIANSKHSSMSQKDEVLGLLVQFAENKDIQQKDFVKDDFYIKLSNILINGLCHNKPKLSQIPVNVLQPLHKDLKFMKLLTLNKKGAETALAKSKEGPSLIKQLFQILYSKIPDENIKIESVLILRNFIKFSKESKFEELVLSQLTKLIDSNFGSKKVSNQLLLIANDLGKKKREYLSYLKDKDILKRANQIITEHNLDKELCSSTSQMVFLLTNQGNQNHPYVIDSQVLKKLPKTFSIMEDNKETHLYLLKSILQLTFKNNQNKQKLCEIGFVYSFVPILKYYTNKNHYCPERVNLVLKGMANFTLIPAGIEVVLFGDIIQIFKKFFEQSREEMPVQNKLMLCTVSNLSYDPKDSYIEKIIKDKGIEYILAALDYYREQNDVDTCEASIDALTHVSSNKITLKYLLDNNTTVIDTLVDMLRQRLNDALVFKSIRCLTKFSESLPLSDRLLEKRGNEVVIEMFQTYRENPKIIFICVKLLMKLIDNYPDKYDEFCFSGIPEKIIKAFNKNWPEEIIRKILEMFAKVAKYENIKDIIADHFLQDLIELMNQFFKNKKLIKNGTRLLDICSDNINSVSTIQAYKGNILLVNTLKSYGNSETIQYNCLKVFENMLLMNNFSKKELLDLNLDKIIKKLLQKSGLQQALTIQAQKVLKLLQDDQFKTIEAKQADEIERLILEGNIKKEKLMESSGKDKELLANLKRNQKRKLSNPVNQIKPFKLPTEIEKFLKQGRILRVYGEDGICRSMHFCLSRDMMDVKCKHPKEQFVKQKWIMPIFKIKEVRYKYDKNSPIARSAGFFKKAPNKEKCFAIFGPIQKQGNQNFHFLCETTFEAKKWVSYLKVLVGEIKKRGLRKN